MSGHSVLPADPATLPLLPLSDLAVFPQMVLPLFLRRPSSIKAVEAALKGGQLIMLVARKSGGNDEPKRDDMFEVGCICRLLQVAELGDGVVKAQVEGLQRAKAIDVREQGEYVVAEVSPIPHEDKPSPQSEALRSTVKQQIDSYQMLNARVPPEVFESLACISDSGFLADAIAARLPLRFDVKQALLDLPDTDRRLQKLCDALQQEVDELQVQAMASGASPAPDHTLSP